MSFQEEGKHTSIIRISRHLQSPWKRRIQIKLHLGPIQKRRTALVGLSGEHGVVETGARVVGVDEEVVVVVVAGGVGGFEVEGFGRGRSGDEGGGGDGGGEEGEGGEEFHFVYYSSVFLFEYVMLRRVCVGVREVKCWLFISGILMEPVMQCSTEYIQVLLVVLQSKLKKSKEQSIPDIYFC